MTVVTLKIATDICVRGDASKLRNKTVDLTERNELGETFLHVAAQHSAECLEVVCGQPGVVLDVATTGDRRHNETPLHLAASCGNEASIRYLLGRNPALAERTDRNGRTPLEYAIDKVNKSHRAHVCAELLAKYTDLHALVRRCLTAKPLRILETLIWLTKHTNVDLCGPLSQNSLGQTPLMVASLFGQPAVVRALLEQPVSRRGGVDDSSSQMQSTPLLLAVQGYCWQVRAGYSPERHWECAVLLLRAGADVNARDSHLNTALHRAATWNQPALISRLLEFGANAVILNGSAHTPIEFAHERGITLGGGDPHWECISALYEASDYAVVRLFARMLDTKPVCVGHLHRLLDMATRSGRFTPHVLWSAPHPLTGVPLAHVALNVLDPADYVSLLTRIDATAPRPGAQPQQQQQQHPQHQQQQQPMMDGAMGGISGISGIAGIAGNIGNPIVIHNPTGAPAAATGSGVTISRPAAISRPVMIPSPAPLAPVDDEGALEFSSPTQSQLSQSAGVVLGTSPARSHNSSTSATASVLSSRSSTPNDVADWTSQGTWAMSEKDANNTSNCSDAIDAASSGEHDVTLGGRKITVTGREHLHLDMACLTHGMEDRLVEDLAIGLATPVCDTPVQPRAAHPMAAIAAANTPTSAESFRTSETVRRCLRANDASKFNFHLHRRRAFA